MRIIRRTFIKQTADDDGKTSYFKMFSLGILVVLPNILSGMSQCYSSIALPEMNVNIETASWFAAVGGYSGLFGILLIGVMIDVYGRKKSLLWGLIPHVIGWALLYWDYSTFVIIVGRILTGLTSVSMFYAPQVYAVECITVNHERLRSNFRAWPGIANSIGALLTFFLGTFLNYRQVSGIATLISVLVLFLIRVIIPESPRWLYLQGRIGDAEICERKLGISQPILQQSSHTAQDVRPDMPVIHFSWSNLKVEAVKLTRRDVYKPVIVMTIVCALIMVTGGSVMNSFMLVIIGTDANDKLVSANSATISRDLSVVSGVLILVAHVCVSLVLPYLGCKKMSISMAFLMCAGMVVIGTTTGENNQSDQYALHVLAVWVVTFAFHFGVLSVPVAVMSDLFPVDAKGFACIAVLTMSLVGAVVIQTYPYLLMAFGGCLYYGYAVLALVYAAFIAFFMPETVGRTYEEVRDYML